MTIEIQKKVAAYMFDQKNAFFKTILEFQISRKN